MKNQNTESATTRGHIIAAKLPSRWNTVSLGEIAEIIMGNSPPGDTYNEVGEGIPLVNGPVEFSEGDFGLTIKSKFTTSPTKMCETGDLLLCVRGSTTGRTNIAAFDACIGRGVAAIRARQHQSYINHFVRTQRQKLFVSGNGSTFPSISQSQIAELQIPLPSPDEPIRSIREQKRIAAILDKADALRRKFQEVTKELSEFPHSLFLDLFGSPRSNPKGWPIMPFTDVCDSRLGKMLDARQQTGLHPRPYLRNLNVQWGRLDLTTVFEMDFDEDDRRGFRLEPGDVMICEGGAGVAQTAVWRGELPECYFQKSLHRVRPFPNVALPDYIAHLFWMLMKSGSLLGSISSATIPHLTGVRLKSLTIPVPPLKLQQTFADQMAARQKMLIKNSQTENEINDLFNSIVQLAFRGEL